MKVIFVSYICLSNVRLPVFYADKKIAIRDCSAVKMGCCKENFKDFLHKLSSSKSVENLSAVWMI